MHLLPEQRQVFAHLDSGDAGRDRLKLAANLFRSRRLHIPQVDVRWSTKQKDEHARLRPAVRPDRLQRTFRRRRPLQTHHVRRPHRAQRKRHARSKQRTSVEVHH